MFKVVFCDVRRETYESVSNVIQLDSCQFRINGHLTNVWFCHMADYNQRTFPQRRYQIYRIEC
jgi:hypothetical protein